MQYVGRTVVRLHAQLIAAVSAILCCAPALAQNAETTRAAGSSAPAAYVYISHTPENSSTNQIEAFRAAANGQLTPIAGSPFREDVQTMAVNGRYMFAASSQTTDINTYKIDSNGALQYVTAIDYAQYNPDNAGGAGPLVLDNTGSSLYVLEYEAYDSNNIYSSFDVNSDGTLKYLGFVNVGAPSFGAPYLAPSFVGYNVFAYTATDASDMYFSTTGLYRSSSHLLKSIQNFNVAMPAPPADARIYYPQTAAADPGSHVAMTLQAENPPGAPVGTPVIVSFTAHGNGDLTTSNTSADMPATEVTFANDLKMSPSGKLLAVGGTGGLQVFHFNGSEPATHYTPLLTTDTISLMFWDNCNHLYAITQSGAQPAPGKLYVFTITPTGYTQAPGSPYTIFQPVSLTVQPLPLP